MSRGNPCGVREGEREPLLVLDPDLDQRNELAFGEQAGRLSTSLLAKERASHGGRGFLIARSQTAQATDPAVAGDVTPVRAPPLP
jgi:hypothetical protein